MASETTSAPRPQFSPFLHDLLLLKPGYLIVTILGWVGGHGVFVLSFNRHWTTASRATAGLAVLWGAFAIFLGLVRFNQRFRRSVVRPLKQNSLDLAVWALYFSICAPMAAVFAFLAYVKSISG